ncbi:MAG: hypothetical protein SFW62_00165 [Alphaproteobacteria bacterium]|nr:hypothetical protein [Alphaproteobacteria bacterium]
MRYEQLHERYGTHIAKRVQVELSASEFRQLTPEALVQYLETRAETAHREYKTRLDNPFVNEELGSARAGYVDLLYNRWREAEDLCYVVTVADGVSSHARATVNAR